MPTTYLLAGIAAMIALPLVVPVAKTARLPWSLFGFVPLLIGVAINLEERMLAARFGPEWERCRRSTRRWL